jgi:3'-phosphoadenosine 5'-phosphosulfate sulfotransferase (PAPS reductase)/FAD synthetase
VSRQLSLFPRADPEGEARQVLDTVIAEQSPSHVFGLFSGGHDSLCATHLVSSHARFTAAVHINTGIGIERTRQFVRDTCRQQGWPLLEYHPPRPPFKDQHGGLWGREGQTAYEALVERWGFPGPQGHTLIYNRLKERCLAQLVRDHRRGRDKVILVTGVRKQESKRRMGHIVACQVDGRRVWCAPLVDWDAHDKQDYLDRHQLPRNPVAEALCMSGECLCGAFARPGELALVEQVCPATAAYIRSLEIQVASAGQALCRWGQKPPAQRKQRSSGGRALPLCHSCEARQEAQETGADQPVLSAAQETL